MISGDLAACAGIVERGDPDRFMAAMAAPVRARAVLFPLYAFNVEVSRAPWVTQEAMIAEMRLQWWRDALAEIAAGGPVRRHEVVGPLASLLSPAQAERLDRLVAVRRWDIYREPFDDAAHFRDYIEQSAGTLMAVAAECLGASDSAPAQAAGYASGVANWLRAVPALERLGRIPLPDGRPEAVRALAREGLARLDRARGTERRARPALLAAFQARALLRRAARDPGRVAEGRLDPSPARRRLLLMAAAATGRV